MEMEMEANGPPPLEPAPPPLEPAPWPYPSTRTGPPVNAITRTANFPSRKSCLIINFPPHTKFYELMTFFRDSDPKRATILSRRSMQHPSTAVLYVETEENLNHALSMDGAYYGDRRIRVVDITQSKEPEVNSTLQIPSLMSQVVPELNIGNEDKTCIEQEPVRRVVWKNSSQGIGRVGTKNYTTKRLMSKSTGKERLRQGSREKGFPFMHRRPQHKKHGMDIFRTPQMHIKEEDSGETMYTLLQAATHTCCPNAQPWSVADIDNSLITLCITVVVDSHHVWGHVIDERTKPDLMWLTGTTALMQQDDSRTPHTMDSKTCCVSYQDEWCRGYVKNQESDSVEVFAIDYGNTWTLHPKELCDLPQSYWDRAAQVWPVKVVSSCVPDLTTLINRKIEVQKLNTNVEDRILRIRIGPQDDAGGEEPRPKVVTFNV